MPAHVAFEDMTARAQVRHMRAVAIDALADYPIRPVRVRLTAHAHNTTFRVDTDDGRRFALRVNLNSNSSVANMDAETSWLEALSSSSDVVVPQPIRTSAGAAHTARRCDVLGRDLRVVVMSWLPGRDLGDRSAEALPDLGRLTAALHDHAETWALPTGAGFPSSSEVLCGDENRLAAGHPSIPSGMQAVVDEAVERVQGHLDDLFAGSASHTIHADIHSGNVKWFRRRLAVFDFDDAMIGLPVQDLGISTYYLRANGVGEASLVDGYAAVRSLPPFTDAQFEAILAGRNLLLLNEVLAAVSRGRGRSATGTSPTPGVVSPRTWSTTSIGSTSPASSRWTGDADSVVGRHGSLPHPQLLDHRAHRPRQVDAVRSHPRDHRRGADA